PNAKTRAWHGAETSRFAGKWEFASPSKSAGPPPLGKQWLTGRPVPVGRGGAMWIGRRPPGSGSVLVMAMMPVMVVMMSAHAGVGVHHLRIVLRRLDHRRLTGLGGRGCGLGRRSLDRRSLGHCSR